MGALIAVPTFSTMSPTIKVAVAQIASTFNVQSTLDKIENCVEEANHASAQLIVFPEATIGGYPKHHAFGTTVGHRTQEGRAIYEEYFKSAITVPGSEIYQLVQMSRKARIFIVLGVIEKSSGSGTLYCTAVYIDPEKGYVGKHRKVMPTASERIIWGQGDGSTLNVFEPTNIPGAVISAAICWENYMPLLRYHYYSKNVNIYCAPTVDSRDTWPVTMQHVALEGRTFVLSACQFARTEDFTGVWTQEREMNEEIIKGGSMIVSPLGSVLAGPSRNKEEVLVADIDLGESIRGKFDLDVVGHYARHAPIRCNAND
jgi:predicted amidohydrolase